MAALKFPPPGKAIDSATVVRWLVGPGERFVAGSTLVELEAELAFISVT